MQPRPGSSSPEPTLRSVRPGKRAVIQRVGGPRAFRRRLLELGLLPGTVVEIVRIAPLGDPMELRARGCTLSIRREQAGHVLVRREASV